MSGNDFWTALAAIVAALTLVGGAFLVGRNIGRQEMKRENSYEREMKRYTDIYTPIVVMFAECHITTVSARGAPYLRQRLRNAWDELRKYRIVPALKALFDKQDTGVFGEVEYGRSFPHQSILSHLKGKEHLADPRLLWLVRTADRSQYEDRPEGNDLTHADLSLLSHVYHEYSKLAKRFTGA